ncbi:hypothetical protein SLA2020_339310 [Shorea laevis]
MGSTVTQVGRSPFARTDRLDQKLLTIITISCTLDRRMVEDPIPYNGMLANKDYFLSKQACGSVVTFEERRLSTSSHLVSV